MAYQRITRDVWEIQGKYGKEWEYLCTEYTLKDARQTLDDYETNEIQYQHRIRKKRERITE